MPMAFQNQYVTCPYLGDGGRVGIWGHFGSMQLAVAQGEKYWLRRESVSGLDLGELETFSEQLWGLTCSPVNGAVTPYYTIILTNQLSVYVYVHMCVSACTHVYVFVCNF